MQLSITFYASQLRVLSSVLSNIASGLILIFPTIKSQNLLIENVLFVTICLVLAIRIEEILLEKYD